MSATAFVLAAIALVILPAPSARRIGRQRVQRVRSTMPRRPDPPVPRPSVLPMIAAAAAIGVGFLMAGPVGTIVGGVSAPLVGLGVRRVLLSSAREPDPATRAAVPLLLDLTAAALRAGVPTARAVGVVAGSAPPALARPLRRTAALLELGAAPSEAWAALTADAVLGSAALLAIRSADSGVRLADSFEAHAGELRAQLAGAGIQRAHRVATFALLPLGLCFLPAFVCVGIVPIVVGIAGSVFGGGRP